MKKPWKEGPILANRLTPHRKFFDERGVSPVIAVILMVAITVVLAAVLYVMVTGIMDPPEITEPGSLSFREDRETPGKYLGVFQGSVRLDKIEISVFDSSKAQTIILYPATETYKEVPDGLNISFSDVNENGKLDATDLLLITKGDPGDKITVVDEHTGNTVATHTLT